jgi:hypothetical protein
MTFHSFFSYPYNLSKIRSLPLIKFIFEEPVRDFVFQLQQWDYQRRMSAE